MENEIESMRAAAIEELKAAFAEIESGSGLTHFVGGHDLQSRVFEFEWREPMLEIDIRLPCLRVLSDEESQREDDAEIGAAVRMAILLMTIAERQNMTSRVTISCNSRGTTYAIYNADGTLEDDGEDWGPLVKRLEAALGDAPENISVIWP